MKPMAFLKSVALVVICIILLTNGCQFQCNCSEADGKTTEVYKNATQQAQNVNVYVDNWGDSDVVPVDNLGNQYPETEIWVINDVFTQTIRVPAGEKIKLKCRQKSKTDSSCNFKWEIK